MGRLESSNLEAYKQYVDYFKHSGYRLKIRKSKLHLDIMGKIYHIDR